MKTAYYDFQLSRVHCIETRSRGNSDRTLISFGLLLNKNEQGRGTSLAPMWNGTVLEKEQISKAATTNGLPVSYVNMSKSWRIGPTEVREHDRIDVVLTGTNTNESDLPTADQEKFDQWTLKALNVYYSWLLGNFVSGLGLAPVPEWIGAPAGALAEFFSDPIAFLLGYEAPARCNGLVFAASQVFTAAELMNLDYVDEEVTVYNTRIPAQIAVIRQRHTDAENHDTDKFGPIAQTEIDLTIRRFPYWSWQVFMPEKNRASTAFPGAGSIRQGARLRLE